MVDRWRDTSVDRQASRSDVVDRMVEMRMEEEEAEPLSARLSWSGHGEVIVLRSASGPARNATQDVLKIKK